MSYRHKSGAEKRKEKERRENDAKRGRKTLFELGWTSLKQSNVADLSQSQSHSQGNDNVQTGNVALPSAQTSPNSEATASETVNTGLVRLEIEHNIQDPNQLEHEFSEIRPMAIGPNSEPVDDSETQTPGLTLNLEVDELLMKETISQSETRNAVLIGPGERHNYKSCIYPNDEHGKAFPISIFIRRQSNGEVSERDWLRWNRKGETLHCYSCRLFSTLRDSSKSSLSKPNGCNKWKKLHEKVTAHENSNDHKMCYLSWRQLEQKIKDGQSVEDMIAKEYGSEKEKWKAILRRILDVVFFLGKRGLAFRGSSHLIDDPQNGNFLGLIELLSRYDALLMEHVDKVRKSQACGRRLQAHYLSHDAQNAFINACGEQVTKKIVSDVLMSKYFALIADATPDASHKEQTTVILRYVQKEEQTQQFKVHERFVTFLDFNEKTGEEIAEKLLKFLKDCGISIKDCRAQGYDNGANMSGKHKGVQSRILKVNALAIFSPCACHTLNLCGANAAECCPDAITFFGSVQKLFNFFSSSPPR